MLSERDIVAKVQHLSVTRLRVWVQQGLIKPADRAAQAFSEAEYGGSTSIAVGSAVSRSGMTSNSVFDCSATGVQ